MIGVTCNLVALDEGDITKVSDFVRKVIPLVNATKHCCFVVLTTFNPDASKSWFDALKDFKHGGKKMVYPVVRKSACEACIKKGVVAAASCTHVQLKNMKMKSSFKQEMFLHFADRVNQKETAYRELLGVNKMDSSFLYDKEDVDWIFNPKNYYKFVDRADDYGDFFDMIMVTVDPSYSGANDFAISFLARDAKTRGVVLLWAFKKNVGPTKKMYNYVFNSIALFHKTYPELQGITKRILIENNSSSVAGSLVEEYGRRLDKGYNIGNVEFVAQKDDRYGVLKTSNNTPRYYELTSDALIDHQLQVCDRFAKSDKGPGFLHYIKNQFLRTPVKRDKKYMQRKSAGVNDDTWVTIAMFFVFYKLIKRVPKWLTRSHREFPIIL